MNNNEVNIIEFELSGEYIELIKLLKLLNLVESGAEAKIIVDSNEVYCNDKIELRKRKKLKLGDIIKYSTNIIKIV